MRTAEHKLNAVQRLKAYREAVTHRAGGSIILPILWLPGPATLAVWVAAGALRESTLTRPGVSGGSGLTGAIHLCRSAGNKAVLIV
jgi:hypothetical protein